MSTALSDIVIERDKQRQNGMDDFDKNNTRNDWIAYINAYTGRAAQKVFRNQREGQSFRDNMVKAAALALAAIESYDEGYACGPDQVAE